MYPMSSFVMVPEFRAMRRRFDVARDQSFWRGYHFPAYPQSQVTVPWSLRSSRTTPGLHFHLTTSAWKAIVNELRRAWNIQRCAGFGMRRCCAKASRKELRCCRSG